MSKLDRTQERQAKNEEREMDGPNMSNVVQVGRTNARGERSMSQDELAKAAEALGLRFENFNTAPGSNVGDDTPDDEPEDLALEELIDQMQFPGDEDGNDDHEPEHPEHEEKNTMQTQGISRSELRIRQMEERRQKRASQKEYHLENRKSASEEVEEVRRLRQDLADAIREEMPDLVEQIQKDIAFLLDNPETKAILDAEERQRREKEEATAKKAREEIEKTAMRDRQNQMSDLYADLPDDPDARPYPDGTLKKLNSPTKALDDTQNKGDKALLVVRIPQGTLVPTGKGGYVKLGEDSAVQLRITVDKVEGTGDERRVFRMARVVKWIGDLHFHQVKARPDAEAGVFNVIPPFFTRREENDRRNDPFDALKEGIYIPHNREFRARNQEEAFNKAAADSNLTATQLLIENAVGSMATEAEWVFRTQDKREYPRHLEVVLQRDEKDGPVHVLAWGPPPADRFAPRLGSLQPRKKDGKIVVIPLEVTARVEKQDEGVKAYVLFTTQGKTLMNGEDDQAKNVRAALRDLSICIRQVLLDEYRAASTEAKPLDDSAEVNHPGEQLESGPTEEGGPAEEQAAPKPRRSRAAAGKGK